MTSRIGFDHRRPLRRSGAVVGPVARAVRSVVQDLAQRLAGPAWSHPFGLDELGRDMLARLLIGARISLLVGLLSVVSISAVVGMALGIRRRLCRRRGSTTRSAG